MSKPIPICKIARDTGGDVPLNCLFGCPHNCAEVARAADVMEQEEAITDTFDEVDE